MEILEHGIKPNILKRNNSLTIVDPIFNIERSRVIAEICNTLMNLDKLEYNDHNMKPPVQVHSFIKRLKELQNDDGSWNEVHPNYNEPSVVFTSISALCLLNYYENYSDNNVISCIESARNYILSQQLPNGGFKKSRLYHIDALNADAMASTFLIKFGRTFNDDQAFKCGLLAVQNICKNQFKDGSYPYTTPKIDFPFKYHLNIPCIHYQTVTLYYLLHIYDEINESWLNQSIHKGVLWLRNRQKSDGSFNWYESGLNFALYLNATYAFTAYIYYKLFNSYHASHVVFDLLMKLKSSIHNGLILRWESSSWESFLIDLLYSLKGGFIGDYPLKYSLFRSVQRIYREISRRRIPSYQGDLKLKNNLLVKLVRDRAFVSTIEPLFNYPDLYTTSQALDALSNLLLIAS